MFAEVIAYPAHAWACIKRGAAYLYRRIDEPTTWTGVVGAIASAKEFPSPLNWLGIGAGVIAILIPSRNSPDSCSGGGQ